MLLLEKCSGSLHPPLSPYPIQDIVFPLLGIGLVFARALTKKIEVKIVFR
jgi:hypothetical protein